MIKKMTIAAMILFLAGMLILTFLAQQIHNASLPRVTASSPETRTFQEQYPDTEGNTLTYYTDKTVIPKELCEQGVYVLYTAEKNGTERHFVRLVSVQTGRITEDGYAEVLSGLMFSDRIVLSSTGILYNGCEVIID